MTADNASSNNVQAAALYELENSFDEANHIRCFNHTIQLSGKALIKPFNAGMGKRDSGPNSGDNDNPNLEDFDHNDDTGGDGDPFEDRVEDDNNNNNKLSEEEHSRLLDDTSAVRETVSKVRVYLKVDFCFSDTTIFLSQLRQLSFAIIHSTTIALPAWR